MPDVYTLVQLANLYGVSINAFLEDEKQLRKKNKSRWLHVLIMLLSCGIVWLVAIFSFVILQIVKPDGEWWLLYLYAVLISAIVLLVYAAIWKHRILNFLSVTTIVWMALACCFLTVKAFVSDTTGLWCIFLIGVPLQVLEILWTFFRTLIRRQRGIVTVKPVEEPTEEKEEKEENEASV